jgi:hypothetical protein
VAIVGYTNAGKSSLLNRLTSAGVLVQNALFATLDPTVRQATTPDGRNYTLTDTVGFVRNLPHQLVEAFRSTLEEAADADLVVPEFSEVFRDCSLVFPRDAHAARRPLDGRWERSEFKANVAPFFPLRHYAHPVTFMTDPEKKHAVVLMMKRATCSAISARYYTPRIEDRAVTYSAVDFHIFGDDLVPGDVRTAQVRLVITPLDESMSQPLALYKKFLAEPTDTPTQNP